MARLAEDALDLPLQRVLGHVQVKEHLGPVPAIERRDDDIHLAPRETALAGKSPDGALYRAGGYLLEAPGAFLEPQDVRGIAGFAGVVSVQAMSLVDSHDVVMRSENQDGQKGPFSPDVTDHVESVTIRQPQIHDGTEPRAARTELLDGRPHRADMLGLPDGAEGPDDGVCHERLVLHQEQRRIAVGHPDLIMTPPLPDVKGPARQGSTDDSRRRRGIVTWGSRFPGLTRMTISGGFLVIDDEEVWRRLVVSIVSPFRSVHAASSLAEAEKMLERHAPLLGLLLDIQLGDGSGLDFLESIRMRGVDTPALVLTGHQDATRINRARTLRAEFLCKPPASENLVSFARRALALHWTRNERVARRIDVFAVEQRLTPRESELVCAAVAGMPRRLVAEEIGVSENTLKAQIRRLLLKCGAGDLDDLAGVILREALQGSAFSGAARLTP